MLQEGRAKELSQIKSTINQGSRFRTCKEGSKKRAVQDEEEDGKTVCRVCSNHFHKGSISQESHGCFACERIFKTPEWTDQILTDHQLYKRRLVCTDCKSLGHTARDVTKYHCGECKRILGHTRFDKDTLKNSKNRGCTLRCIECNNKCKCIVCGLRFEKNKAKKNEICYNCQQNGYSMMHTKT